MNFEIITALITPFLDNGKIDIKSLFKIIKFQLQSGIDKFVLFGTTGEGNSILLEEKIDVIKKIKKEFENNIYLMIGISKNNIEEATKEIKKLNNYNIDSFLILTPYYLTTNEQGVIEYFNSVANISKKPIYIYYVPKRTGQRVTINAFEILKTHPNIEGIKYVLDDENELKKLTSLKSENFKIYLGNDELMINGLRMNLNGVISVISNISPYMLLNIIFQKDYEKFEKIRKLIDILFFESNPIPIKYLMSLKGFCKLNYRSPLTLPSIDVINKINSVKELYEN